MSILIRGVEMPTDHPLWIVVHSDGTVEANEVSASRPVGWQTLRNAAVPVPPHGRLGDLDKQDAQIEALIERHLHGYTKSTWDFVCELRDILKRNHTIIPAEEGET